MWHDLDDDSPGRHPYVTTAEARAVVRDEHVGLQEQVDLRERWQALQDHLLEDRSSSSRQALQISDYLLHVLDASDRPLRCRLGGGVAMYKHDLQQPLGARPGIATCSGDHMQ
jgi:hypothetical protein